MKKWMSGLAATVIVVAVWAGNALWWQTRQAEGVSDVAVAWLNGTERVSPSGPGGTEPDLAPWYGGFFIGVAGLLLLTSLARDSLSRER